MTKTTAIHKLLENRKASGATPDFTPNFYNPHEVKHRRRTSRGQTQTLERAFRENPRPSGRVREGLAADLAMSPRGVQIWFQNRRAKAKQQKQQQVQQDQELYQHQYQQHTEEEEDQPKESHDNSKNDYQLGSLPSTYLSTPMAQSHSQSSLSSYPESLDNFHPLIQPLFHDPYTMPIIGPCQLLTNDEWWTNNNMPSYTNAYLDNNDWTRSRSYIDSYLDQSSMYFSKVDSILWPFKERSCSQPTIKETSHISDWMQTVPTKKPQLHYEDTMIAYPNMFTF